VVIMTDYGLSDAGYELADAIELVMEAEPTRWWLPSELARKLKRDTAHVRPVLQWMARNRYVDADRDDLNSWTRYRDR
jgi:DNA-binding IclR family transcriptional regulator